MAFPRPGEFDLSGEGTSGLLVTSPKYKFLSALLLHFQIHSVSRCNEKLTFNPEVDIGLGIEGQPAERMCRLRMVALGTCSTFSPTPLGTPYMRRVAVH